VLYFKVAELMQIRLPPAILRQVIGYTFTNENVTCIVAIHYPLRNVDAGAGNILALIRVFHVMDRPTVDAHSHWQTRLRPQRMTDLERALYRLFHRAGKDQCHAIAGRQDNELAGSFRFARCFRGAHELIQFLQSFRLLVDQQLGIANDVEKKDVGDLQPQLGLLLVSH
jgi:hypothetical protein